MSILIPIPCVVALRKESVDRNTINKSSTRHRSEVALRKESVDRNAAYPPVGSALQRSLSARRAWIEIFCVKLLLQLTKVALRKESVDRNSTYVTRLPLVQVVALRKESVDRNCGTSIGLTYDGVALRKESVDRNETSSR